MDLANSRDRIWNSMHRAERMSRYYSKRSRQLDFRYKVITFVIALIPLAALALYQTEVKYSEWSVPILLSVAGFCEFALIHFGLGGDTKAAKVMANQSTELAQQWRVLWIDQNREDIVKWIESLERQAIAITTESIPYREDVNDECFEETKYVLASQFGG